VPEEELCEGVHDTVGGEPQWRAIVYTSPPPTFAKRRRSMANILHIAAMHSPNCLSTWQQRGQDRLSLISIDIVGAFFIVSTP
jgi:hypothetical protein